ncbi:HAMP domain-containing histidine kinase [Macrococcus brunensis]|uniref:histidine kinase n=1 Tax=Macrococcus brunensis TaxID=198483 RepID=A0A4R6BGP9_9STAP|nr:HAMP domain-containing sensor histidine kinase [Macrococcus brunensis]TDL98943.1 HAMP domain-containing histidine kinase [Macrococcus brunensis]
MNNQLKRLFIFFAALIFLLLISFSLIAYFSLSSSIHYQQQLESRQKLAEEKDEHFINTASGPKLSLEDPSSDDEAVLYFITDGKHIVKSSQFGQPLIKNLYQRLPPYQLNHQLYFIDERYFTVASMAIKTPSKTYWIYTIHDSTEAYHGLKQLRTTLFSLVILYVLLIALVSYSFAKRAIEPYTEGIQREQQFIQDATHELKTPLAVMQAATDVIKLYDGKKLSSESQNALEDMRSEITDMSSLITDLTLLSKVVNLKPLNLSELCEDNARKLRINSSVEPDIFILGDSQALKRLIYILTDNARKYNHADVQIYLTLRTVGSDTFLTVRDNGSGVPDEALPYVFDRFYRAKGQQHIAGSGIGLALFKSIVDQHHAIYQAYNDNGFVIVIKIKKI